MYQHLQLFGDMNPILRPISLLKDTLNTKTHGASSIDCGFLELQRSNRNIENLRNNTNQTQISKIIQINTKELVLNDTQHVGRDGLNNVSNERDGVGGRFPVYTGCPKIAHRPPHSTLVTPGVGWVRLGSLCDQ